MNHSNDKFMLRVNRKSFDEQHCFLERQQNQHSTLQNRKSFNNDIKIRRRSTNSKSFSKNYIQENAHLKQSSRIHHKYISELQESPIHKRPLSSKILMNSQPNLKKSTFIYSKQIQFIKCQPRVSIMNLQLVGVDEENNRWKQEQEEINLIKNLLQRKKKERALQREKEKLLFRQKCLQLLHKNQKIKFQEQPNYRLIKQILSELKVSRTIGLPQDSHVKILESSINMKQSISSTKFASSISQEKINNKNENRSLSKKYQSILFKTNDYASDKVYKKKISAYLEFLYKINFSNCIYVQMKLKDIESEHQIHKYKAYVGKGNNSLLIKSLLKRRFWFQILDGQVVNYEKINFAWTQLNIPQLSHFQEQSKSIKMSEQIKKRLYALKNKKFSEKNLNHKIMNKTDSVIVENYLANFTVKTSLYPPYQSNIVTNHIPQNYVIGSKKALFHSIYHYLKNCLQKNPFQYIPQTFHIKSLQDDKFKQFLQLAKTQKSNKIWIIKPGQNTNRGNGINLIFTKDIQQSLYKKFLTDKENTYIIQSYINRPMLYHNRKFDIRHYMMITSVNGIMKVFWYKEGYIRTSSIIYNIDDIQNVMMHLTNDAIQKSGESYGLYEQGNKISYVQFQRYLDMTYPAKKYNFENDIINKMKQITLQVVRSSFIKIDRKRKLNNFQLFGLDFMIDNHFKPWLIQINSNPCLEISCPLLERIIPAVIQNTLRIGLDPLFPPPVHYPATKRYLLSDNILLNLKYELLFDEKIEGQKIRSTYENCTISEEFNYHEQQFDKEDQYEDNGKQVEVAI